MANPNRTEMKQIYPDLRRAEPVASFLQGSLIWITEYEEFVDGSWHTRVSIHPRRLGHSYDEDDVPVHYPSLLGMRT